MDSAPRLATPSDLLAVAAGGMAGTLLRAALLLAAAPTPDRAPWVTVGENLVGAFLLGLFLALLPRWAPKAPLLHPLFAAGLLGSFTTFSALAVDLLRFEAGGEILLYLFLSVPGGLAAATLGLALGRRGAAREGAR